MLGADGVGDNPRLRGDRDTRSNRVSEAVSGCPLSGLGTLQGWPSVTLAQCVWPQYYGPRTSELPAGSAASSWM